MVIARTLSAPNSTTATKLLPLVPYHFFVPGFGLAPNEASDPHRADVNPTGMLGALSLNGCTMSPVRRWKRLISPHGVFQLPKFNASVSDATARACKRSAAVARRMAYSIDEIRSRVAARATLRSSSSAQNTASDVATELADQRMFQSRRILSCSATLAFSRCVAGSLSAYLTTGCKHWSDTVRYTS